MESTPFTAYRKEHANAANDKPQTLAELDLLDDFLFNALLAYAYGHFPRPAGPHFPDSLGHIKRTAQ